jgi:2-methylcitrate dehydratase PrpD
MKTLEILSEPTLLPLARFVVTTKFENIPQLVIYQAKLSLLDTLGCIIRGYCLEEAAKVIKIEKEIGGNGEATIVCSGDKVPALAAARANGFMGDILEFNDLTSGHSGIGNIPAAMAMAEYQRASGRSLLTAIAIGYEVTGRIHDTYYSYRKPLNECCIQTVGVVNSFGSAAAASKLFGLDVEKTFHAMNIAGSLAAISPAETPEKGGTIKPYLFGGWSAAVGIFSAICAKNGLTGTSSILEGRMGLLRTFSNTFDLSPISEKLGEKWALERPRRKAHACCGYTHSPIEATMAAIQENGVSLDEIERIDLSVAPYTITLVGGESPPNATASKFSMRYLVAGAIRKMSSIEPEDTMEEEYNRNMRSGILQLMKKINIKAEPSYPHYSYCKANVVTASGKEYAKFLKHPKGDPENQLTESELLAKFRMLSRHAFKPNRIDEIIEYIFQLEKSDNITGLANSLICPLA